MPVVKTHTNVQQSPSGQGLNKKKSRQQRKKKSYYALQFTKTEFNRRKKLGRYIRSYPEDIQAQNSYTERFGVGSVKGLLANITWQAERRGARRLISKPPRSEG